MFECNEIGCRPSTFVEFSNSKWEEGTWTVIFRDTDREVGRCKLRLPASPDQLGDCQGNLRMRANSTGEGLGWVSSRFPKADESPSRPTILVRRNNVTVLERELEPKYEIDRPNGESCPPKCKHAEYTVFL